VQLNATRSDVADPDLECLFRTIKFTKSVRVALATPSSVKPSALTPRKFWQKQFHAPNMEADERERRSPSLKVKRKTQAAPD